MGLLCGWVGGGGGGGGGVSPVSASSPERLVDSASPVYQAVQSAEEMQDEDEGGHHRQASSQSKTFQTLAHMMATETQCGKKTDAVRRMLRFFRESSSCKCSVGCLACGPGDPHR